MIPGGEGMPPAGAPAPAAPVPAAKRWAQDIDMAPEQRATRLEPAPTSGTVKHPFPVIEREQYMAMIKPYGSMARRTNDAPIALVNLSDLMGIQGSVNEEQLSKHLYNPKLIPEGSRGAGHGGLIDRPVVVRKDGQFYIHDGHHRLTAAQLRGQTTAKVRFIDLDAEDQGP